MKLLVKSLFKVIWTYFEFHSIQSWPSFWETASRSSSVTHKHESWVFCKKTQTDKYWMFSLQHWRYVHWLTYSRRCDVWIYVIAVSRAKGQGLCCRVNDLYPQNVYIFILWGYTTAKMGHGIFGVRVIISNKLILCAFLVSLFEVWWSVCLFKVYFHRHKAKLQFVLLILRCSDVLKGVHKTDMTPVMNMEESLWMFMSLCVTTWH